MLQIWYYTSTATHLTFQFQSHAAASVACFSAAKNPHIRIISIAFIGAQEVKISVIITQNIIQHNITKICADSYCIRKIAFRFCEGVLNYARSRNPGCARTHTQRHIHAPREPLNVRVCLRVCALSQDRTLILIMSHNFSNDMMNITHLNEVH
jgi:hypothetical protein